MVCLALEFVGPWVLLGFSVGMEAVVYTNQDGLVVWIRLNVTRYVKRVVLFLPQSVTVSGWPCVGVL